MRDLTPNQLENLVKAVHAANAAKIKVENAQKDMAQKLENLKTCSQASGQFDQVMAESMAILGAAYLKLQQE